MGGAPWFSGTKHNNTCKPHSCGTLLLQGLSLTAQTPPALPPQPLHPFLEALPHTTLGGRITWGVCVCLSSVSMRPCVSARENKRNGFCIKVPFKQLWVEHGRLNPFSFSLWIPLTQKCVRTNNLLDKISLFLFYFKLLGYIYPTDIKYSWFIEIFCLQLCNKVKAVGTKM